MDDLTEIDSGLDFNNSSDPKKIHGNWFWGKLEEYTMKRESEIKGETMGLDIRKKLSTEMGILLSTAITGEVSYATENTGEIAAALLSFKSAYEAITDQLPQIASLGQRTINVFKDMWYSNPNSLQVFLHYVSASIIVGTSFGALTKEIPIKPNTLENIKELINE